MIEIEQNKYGHNLLGLFWTYRPTGEEDQKLYALLSRVCHAWVIKRDNDSTHETISGINLNDEEQNLVKKYQLMDHPNLEVRTRFTDAMIRFGKGKEKLERMRKASDGYLELCKATGVIHYFLRSIEIRQVKSLYDEPFMQMLKDLLISTRIHPGWLAKTLNHIKINVVEGLENKYIKDILSVYAADIPKNDVLWVDSYWKMMCEIGAVEESEGHYQRALNWENYADETEAHKKENVFNANLHTILQDSYKEIFEVKEKHPIEYKRIRDKYNAAKKDFVDSLSHYGVRMEFEIPQSMIEHIHKDVADTKVETIEEAIFYFLQVPYFPASKQWVDKLVEKSIQQSDVIERFFPKTQALDEEGNVKGISNCEQSKKLPVHGCIRLSLLHYLYCLYVRIEEHIFDYSEVRCYEVLNNSRPSFVEEDMVQIWAKAYHYYFQGDVVIASHLLMPQFEHALHNLLEEIVEDITLLNNDIQKEPTLIRVLDQLEPYCNSTLYDELFMFLVDGNDVNYRNRLLHGLMGSMDMLQYGHYLFYLSNQLYFKGKDFLKIGEEQNSKS